MDNGTVGVLLFLVLLIRGSFPKRDFLIHIEHADCTSPSKRMNTSCSVTKWNNRNRHNSFNMFLQTTEDIYNIRYNLSIEYGSSGGKSERFLEFSTMNMCEFLGAKFTSPILLISRKITKKYSNFPNGCPLRKAKEYYIKRMKFDPEIFPAFMPKGQFASVGAVYDEKEILLGYDIGYQVTYKSNSKS